MKIAEIVKRIQANVVMILAIIMLAPLAYSWGHLGHRVSVEMAESRLTPQALSAVHDLLGPEVSLADASTWADEQKNPRSGSWHYVNVPITESRYDSRFCLGSGCVVSKISDFKRILQDPQLGKAEKQRALKYLIQLIADLHQPLHVGDTGSRGGNLVQVRFFNRGSNLHKVWDTQIMERQTEDEQEWVRNCSSLISDQKAAEWSKGAPEDWATETPQVAKVAYCQPGSQTAMNSGTQLRDDYVRVALPIIRRQLPKAGVRIAWVLNEICH